MAAKAFEMVQEHRDNIIEFPKPVNNKKKGKKSGDIVAGDGK